MALSAVLGIVPLLGIVWTVQHADVTTVGGLFLTLILLSLSGIMFLNMALEIRNRRKKAH